MTIIKGRKNNPPEDHNDQDKHLDSALFEELQAGEPEPEKEPEPVWTPAAVETGELPDRRETDRRLDRRNRYRRVEDKELISRAQEEADEIREQARKEGFEQGVREASESLEEVQSLLEEFMTARNKALDSAADEIAAIAVEVAERVIKTEVACDETLVIGLVRDTIQKSGRETKTILIKTNPEDSHVVKDDLKANPLQNLDAEIIVMDDPTVDNGSCRVETSSGMIDASFSTQLAILRQLFGASPSSSS